MQSEALLRHSSVFAPSRYASKGCAPCVQNLLRAQKKCYGVQMAQLLQTAVQHTLHLKGDARTDDSEPNCGLSIHVCWDKQYAWCMQTSH